MNYLDIKDSIYEDINVNGPYTILQSDELILKIENTLFSNCHTGSGYLFNVKNQFRNQYIQFKNVTFTMFQGDNIKINIIDSIFKNITSRNTLPALIDSKYSVINITSSLIENFDINSELIRGESQYYLKDDIFNNIKTNSNSLLSFLYNSVEINNVTVTDIQCIGEYGNTSFILFNSGENPNKLSIKNSNMQSNKSNDSFIKIIGDSIEFVLENSIITKMKCYGPIIDIKSNNSNVLISGLNYSHNINSNKSTCGNIHFSNNLKVSINKSNFTTNICNGNGGILCMDNLIYMDLYIISNLFENNKAINGGAIYFEENKNDISINGSGKIENNTFINNIAENFGGAIYSKHNKLYLVDSNNNEIINNKAGINGAGIFVPYSKKANSFNLSSNIIENNTINSYNNNYSSNPSYITLNNTYENIPIKIISGDYLPLCFILYDEFDIIMMDITKYYSSMSLKVIMEEKNKNFIEAESNNNEVKSDKNGSFTIIGNVCSFTNGQCDLNNLRIFANPNNYTLKIRIDNYNGILSYKFSNIEIEVLSCKSNQVKMKNKNKILYCENPICDDKCPIGISAICEASKEENVNDFNKNKYKCLKGWHGINCQDKDYMNFSKINKAIYIITIPVIIIIFFNIITIILNKKEKIIKDTGYYKILFFSVGLIIYFISNFFITYRTYFNCALYFLFKHIGIFTILCIFYIYVIMGSKLGIVNKQDNKYLLVSSNISLEKNKPYNVNANNYSYNDHNDNNNNNDNIEEINQQIEIKLSMIKSSNSNLKKSKSSIDKKNENKILKRNIKQVHSLIYEILFIYPIYIASIITVIIFKYFKNENYNDANINYFNQNNDGYWSYQCPLNKSDFVYNLISLLLLIVVLSNGKTIINYECIFKCTRYITYSTYVFVVLGPLINIVGFVILNNQRYERVIFETLLNTICYIIVFLFFSWDKLYYIIKKEKKIENYFIYKNYEMCSLHKSLTCGCQLEKKNNNVIPVIEKYIDFYKFCSAIVEKKNGKTRLVRVESKISIFNDHNEQ
ncbi:hypothetical protein BCR36DRAFT_175699 [Piromyces finnis]|uniref:G-protein coupled receptors family 3 profile domain-containing protein n=1 Tax=Piromyces finnis TaxID=1754191 RepID=A0A1Y1VI54_9FUNG|nr:hypothetical protein BCR36DRAFT_175699 [Piromyces finnis]|eukprot:ORX56013.1 hypothetical protein BCR36DRAFT_175699 [Piromyces finnis]